MEVSTRTAEHGDVARLIDLYREMEIEQTARKPIWALTDGLDEAFSETLSQAIDDADSFVLVGQIDGATVGFLWATIEPMLDRARGTLMGRVRLIYTEPEARGVGVGHVLLSDVMNILRDKDIHHFDAPVGPGHRAAKNFFESHAFAARSIIMHSADPTASTISHG